MKKLFEELKTLIIKPVDFFTTVAPKKTFRQAFMFDLATAYIGMLPLLLLYSSIFSLTIQKAFPVPFYTIIGGAVTLIPLTFVILGLVISFFSFLILKIAGGKGTYLQTYKVDAYAGFPSAVGTFLFMVGGGILSIYSCVLQVIGYAKTHKVSYWKGALPLIVYILVTIIGVVALFGFIFSQAESSINLVNASQKIDADFIQMFASFQTINGRIGTLTTLDFTVVSQVETAQNHLDTVEQEIESIKQTMGSLNDTITQLKRSKKLSDSSRDQLFELEDLLEEYSDSLNEFEKAAEGYDKYIRYSEYQSQITLKLDKFLSFNDLSKDYVVQEQYGLALEQTKKAIVINTEMLEIRENQHAMFAEEFTILERLLAEDKAYDEHILMREKELEALVQNPNIQPEQQFKKSDELYEKYNTIFVEPNEYLSSIASWLDKNIDRHVQKANDIATAADIKYNSLMQKFYLTN